MRGIYERWVVGKDLYIYKDERKAKGGKSLEYIPIQLDRRERRKKTRIGCDLEYRCCSCCCCRVRPVINSSPTAELFLQEERLSTLNRVYIYCLISATGH